MTTPDPKLRKHAKFDVNGVNLIPCEHDDPDVKLVTSQDGNGHHLPAIDIDVPCHLVASSTPGHFHLYIDWPVPHPNYFAMIKAMVEAGIVENGYYQASLAHGFTRLRPPGVDKNSPQGYLPPYSISIPPTANV